MDSIAIAGASPKGDCRPPLSTPFLALWSPCGPTSSAPSPSNRVDGDIKPHADPEVYTGVGIPGPCPARADIWTIQRAGRQTSSLFVCLRHSASRRSGPLPLWPYLARAPPRPHRALVLFPDGLVDTGKSPPTPDSRLLGNDGQVKRVSGIRHIQVETVLGPVEIQTEKTVLEPEKGSSVMPLGPVARPAACCTPGICRWACRPELSQSFVWTGSQ